MKKRTWCRRSLVWLLSVLVVVEAYAFTASHYDARRIGRGEDPILSVETAIYFDGGTTIYMGLGYTLTEPRSIAGVHDGAGKSAIGYAVRKTGGIKYWVPIWPILSNREASAEYRTKVSIQSPQRNAGSSPSSMDSLASETSSSLGPRG